MDCTILIAKTKALISCAVTAQLICVFVFAYAKKPVFSERGSYGLKHPYFKSDIIACLVYDLISMTSNMVQ